MSSNEIDSGSAEGWVGAKPLTHKLSALQAGIDEDIMDMAEHMVTIAGWTHDMKLENFNDLVADMRKLVSISPSLPFQVYPPETLAAMSMANIFTVGGGKMVEEVKAHQYVWGYSTKNLNGWVHEPVYQSFAWRLSPKECRAYERIKREDENEMQTGRV